MTSCAKGYRKKPPAAAIAFVSPPGVMRAGRRNAPRRLVHSTRPRHHAGLSKGTDGRRAFCGHLAVVTYDIYAREDAQGVFARDFVAARLPTVREVGAIYPEVRQVHFGGSAS
jgi:hypothetical protein